MSVRSLPRSAEIGAVASSSSGSDGFPWIWVIVIGGVFVVGLLAVGALATSVGLGRRRAAWHDQATRLVQEGLVIVDLAAPSGRLVSHGLETLADVEDRLDQFLRKAGPIRKKAPSIASKELVENLCRSGSTFAAAVAADRAIRDGVTARTAQQQSFSTQRVVERMHEFDLNLREFSWQLDELP